MWIIFLFVEVVKLFWRKKPAPTHPPSAGTKIIESIRPQGHELQEPERQFIEALGAELCAAKLSLLGLDMQRMSTGMFNVFYSGIYVGKVLLRQHPGKWAIVRPGAKRPAKVFDAEIPAREYLATRPGYELEYRPGKQVSYMQYQKGLYTTKDLESPTLEDCIGAIRHWVTYIQKQLVERRKLGTG